MDRALGNPLGNPLGLVREAGQRVPDPMIVEITAGSGVYTIPSGFRYAVITAVGGGGGASYSASGPRGGGGGGVSRTNPIPLKESMRIEYSIGEGGVPTVAGNIVPGGDTLVRIAGYEIVAGGAKPGTVSGSTGCVGGTASGGDFNYKGSDGTLAGAGGGAAGLFGDGGVGGSGCGGNGGSAVSGQARGGGGGGGIDGDGGKTQGGGAPALPAAPTQRYLTYPGTSGSDGTTTAGGNGGPWGGGGGSYYSGNVNTQGKGGNGGVRIELW